MTYSVTHPSFQIVPRDTHNVDTNTSVSSWGCIIKELVSIYYMGNYHYDLL